jgi:hypothetical protein
MVVCMVLHIIKILNGFIRRGDVKHYPPGKIMTNCGIHANNSTVKLRKMLNHEIVSLQELEVRFCWVIPATYQVDRCSLLRTLVLP